MSGEPPAEGAAPVDAGNEVVKEGEWCTDM